MPHKVVSVSDRGLINQSDISILSAVGKLLEFHFSIENPVIFQSFISIRPAFEFCKTGNFRNRQKVTSISEPPGLISE